MRPLLVVVTCLAGVSATFSLRAPAQRRGHAALQPWGDAAAVPLGSYKQSCDVSTEKVDTVAQTVSVTCSGQATQISFPYGTCVGGLLSYVRGQKGVEYLRCERGLKPEFAAQAPVGSFLKTCNEDNMGVDVISGTVKVTCENAINDDKTSGRTQIFSYKKCLQNSLANYDGALGCEAVAHPCGLPQGDYSETCKTQVNQNAGVIHGMCDGILTTPFGRNTYRQAFDYCRCQYNEVVNDKGHLRCRVDL